ncbi:MAG TPA: NAD-dependent epimerase/dehydratase family protein [Baekduia sp.]|uniref:NAD-dependent epimerase/dehydratase family protein n=1 Tax=Baekduia sp. TaxID=2600305 RepID=UPI002D76C540|nr:NAD-dependent epimerase/dehydratase family protein [Baekduia sp.]HET6507427.1 NAD-dependent epimerase/dehydratase family protein [Baekduia sp.]
MTATLVTGAGGVIGGALVRALRERGHHVTTLTRTEGGDATDPDAVARAAAGARTIFHLAPADPSAVLTAGAPRVVLASSVLVYGDAEGALREDHTRADARDGAIVARLTNTYGPGDLRPDRLVPTLQRAARDGTSPRLRSDGSPARDFLHADDAASALIALAERGTPGEAYNIGTGVATPVRQVVALFERAVGRPLHPVYDEDDVDRSSRWADLTKITATTGWRPAIALADGLRRI